MKKVLVGCLVVLVFGMFATCVGGYLFVWRPISGFVAQGNAFINYEARLTNQQPFEGAADFRLTSEQVERFVAINRAVDASLGENVDAMRQVLNQQANDAANIGEMMSALGELKRLMGIAGTARDVQVDAMNAANMSAAEYRWIRDRFLSALVPGVNLAQLQESFQQGNFQIPGMPALPNMPAVPGIPQLGGGAADDAAKEDSPPNKSKTDDKPPAPTADKPDSARTGATTAAIEVAAPTPVAIQPAAAPAEGTAAAPQPTNVDVIAQLPGGRVAYDHNRALIEPYREEAMGWIRNWAASF